jgi:antitoxin MazE
MKTNIIHIGNSRGIRIPKVLLEQSQLGTEVELEVEDHKIIIRSAARPRQDWGEKFQLMAEQGDDDQGANEIPGEQTEWDRDDWQW